MSSKRKQKLAQRREMQAEQDLEPEVEYAPPDRATRITWPRHLADTLDDRSMVALWPNNVNSRKTIPQGRRVAVTDACDDPIVEEMSEVCQYLKLSHVVEPYKQLPRDVSTYPGRIRVRILDDTGHPLHPDVGSRKALLRKMGELIPKLQIRQRRVAMETAHKHQIEEQAAAGPKANSKKKGKKRR
jgi:signal recognition particle subunit SRP19